ncbi:DUF4136 domain-containing protein [Alteromonas aestuariivivens]|uniref:DUF4136 domain-containing protein n=1 Tax=Alteromonas aestuariivivens TaxID=1938339 RepID=A0A3D8M9T4_9ALTE|nr:DUF4136 domain-containing protein [Alteromonas aestuariivivens]RDV26624.1 DUF4136 domain-containing protein [Alteromonas aestuariivivens]
MKALKVSLMLIMLIVVVACSSRYSVESDYDDSFDFSALSTYQWYAGNEYTQQTKTFLNNDILDKRIRENIDGALQARGYLSSDANDVDFLVNYSVTSEPRVDVDTYNTYSGFAPGWGYGRYGPGPFVYGGVGMGYQNTETRVTHYDQGSLVIDVIDPVSNKLVWRGTANGRLPKNMTPEEKSEAVKNVVNNVLSNFPPSK